jgi:hypothetical protein
MADTLVPVRADKAMQFVDNGRKAMRSRTKPGETTYNFHTAFTFQQTISKVTLTLETSTKRVHWAGPVKTRPDPENAAAIKNIEALSAAHEGRHRDSYQAVFDKAKDQLVGKTQKEAKVLLDEFHQKLLDACEKRHASEGMITVKASGGKVSVTERAEGLGGCRRGYRRPPPCRDRLSRAIQCETGTYAPAKV